MNNPSKMENISLIPFKLSLIINGGDVIEINKISYKNVKNRQSLINIQKPNKSNG